MHSHESLRRLVRLQTLCSVREQRAQAKLNRAIMQHDDLLQRLQAADHALNTNASERQALFEDHRGMLCAGELFHLKRRESLLEARRIDLMLELNQIKTACTEVSSLIAHARFEVTYARRRRAKLMHVVGRVQRHVQADVLLSDDEEMEERIYEP